MRSRYLLLLLLVSIALPASSTLIGATVEATLPDTAVSATSVIGAGRDFQDEYFTLYGTRVDSFMDIGIDRLTIGFDLVQLGNAVGAGSIADEVFSCTFLDWGGPAQRITGLSLLSSSPELDSRHSDGWRDNPNDWFLDWTDNSISIVETGGFNVSRFETRTVYATFRVDTEPVAVPEPASMLILGCLGAGMFAVRKLKHHA